MGPRARLRLYLVLSVLVTCSALCYIWVNVPSSDSSLVPNTNENFYVHKIESFKNVQGSNSQLSEAQETTQNIHSAHDSVAGDMKRRLQTLQNACHKHDLIRRDEKDPLRRVNPWEYFVIREPRAAQPAFVWCNVFKSGSSSWMHLINRLAGKSEYQLKRPAIPLLTSAREFFGRPTEEELLQAVEVVNATFIIGRHPFERLVSAYKDKIYGAIRGSYHDKMGRQIIARYSSNHPSKGSGRRRVLFNRVRRKPTFAEFVSYVLDCHRKRETLDLHWTPVYREMWILNCLYITIARCSSRTFDRDQTYILDKISISQSVRLKRVNSSKDGIKTSSQVDQYISELEFEDPKLLRGICDLYKIDFDIFGYEYAKCK